MNTGFFTKLLGPLMKQLILGKLGLGAVNGFKGLVGLAWFGLGYYLTQSGYDPSSLGESAPGEVMRWIVDNLLMSTGGQATAAALVGVGLADKAFKDDPDAFLNRPKKWIVRKQA